MKITNTSDRVQVNVVWFLVTEFFISPKRSTRIRGPRDLCSTGTGNLFLRESGQGMNMLRRHCECIKLHLHSPAFLHDMVLYSAWGQR